MVMTTIISRITASLISRCKLLLLTLGGTVLVSPAVAEQLPGQGYNGHTLPQEQYLGYRPSVTLFVEMDIETGRYQAIDANQAKFDRAWMDQDNAKVGNDAVKALIKVAGKALYRRLYQLGNAKRYHLPDEEGRINLNSDDFYDLDYRLNVSSNSLSVGMVMSF